ncbi:MAG: NADH-quinone oxidoreductase subunit NuoF, partial [Planctomycetaceae bacterium]
MPEFQPVLLKNAEVTGAEQIAVYRGAGGYRTTERVLKEMSPDEVVEVVREAGLRGRGGAGFPCGVKWGFLPKDRTTTYMCINADESEPGTFNNRILMERDPHQLLEGAIIASYATQAAVAYIYIRYEFEQAYHVLQQAINEAHEAGYLGQNILGTDFSLEIYLHRGAAAYICGEETGLIESLEGKRAWPRIKPPFPAVEGVFRQPTVVNNVETLCCVTNILDRGADWFRSIGVPADPDNPRDIGSYGPKLYCLSGHVNRPGCYEQPLGVSCRELIEEHGQGVWKGRNAKAAIPGGISMGLLREEEFDTRLDFSELQKVDCLGLGTAAVVVFDDQTSMVDVLYNSCRFFAHESCGQCTPCR